MDEIPTLVRDMLQEQLVMSVAASLDQTIGSALRKYTGEDFKDPAVFAGRLSKVKRVGTDGETYCLDGVPFLWVSDLRFDDIGGSTNVSFDTRMLSEPINVHPD